MSRKSMGTGPRKSMDETAEAERIRRMEAQLQSFDSGRGGVVQDEGGDDSESSDEEDSDDEE
jgi:bromodomain-containing factor 1